MLAILLTSGALIGSASAQTRSSPNRCPAGLISQETARDTLELTMLGVACFERGEFGQALSFYRTAYARSREPLLEAAIGRSLHELGLYSSAKVYYDLYLQHERVDSDGRQRIEERAQRLDAQLQDSAARVSLDAFPGNARVFIQTHEGHRELLGTTPLTTSLEPKKYTITLEQKGFLPETFTVNPSPGDDIDVQRELVPQRATFNLTTRATRRIGAITLLTGLPILTTGATLRLLDRPLTRRESQAVMLVGGTTMAVGATIMLIGYRRERRLRLDHQTLTLSTHISPAWSGVTLTW